MARQRMAMESFHGEAVSRWRGNHPWGDSERIAMEYSHCDTASVQRIAREPCHGETAGG